MGLTLADNRSQAGFGTFLILLCALYGTYIYLLFITVGHKGGFYYADSLLFLIVFFLLVLTNFGKLIIIRTFMINQNSILLLFFLYLLLRTIDAFDSQILNPTIIFSYVGVNLISGFIAFSVLRLHIPIASLQGAKSTKWAAIIGTLIFIATILYIMTHLMSTSLVNIFQFQYLNNAYYQTFGDYISIAYCCLVSLQISYFKRSIYQNRLIVVFVLVISAQVILACICLQMVNSSKSVVLITLVSAFAIYYCKPKHWLISYGRINVRNLFYMSFLLLLVYLLLTQLLQELDVYRMRIFDYGSSSLLENKSLESRFEIIRLHGMDQLLMAPLFGDISIENYMHSSVLSVQSHLGFIGSLLLWSFVLIQLRNVYRDGGNECLKTIALPILFVSAISSFFTWSPLWFLIGALYEYTSPIRDRSG